MRAKTEIAPVRSESSRAIEAKIERADVEYHFWRRLEAERSKGYARARSSSESAWRLRAYSRATQNLYRWDRIKTRLICDLHGIAWRKAVPA